MSENITFSVSGSETYYHKDWLKSKGFKWVPSGKKWEKVNILELEADQLSEYCREFGLYYERSDKGMPKFDYESYLWDPYLDRSRSLSCRPAPNPRQRRARKAR